MALMLCKRFFKSSVTGSVVSALIAELAEVVIDVNPHTIYMPSLHMLERGEKIVLSPDHKPRTFIEARLEVDDVGAARSYLVYARTSNEGYAEQLQAREWQRLGSA